MSIRMTRIRAFLPVLGLLLAAPALAHSYKAGTLEVGHPWARETPVGATTGAGFFKVSNTGDVADTLIAVESPGAAKIEMHESIEDNGVAKMRAVTAVEIPAKGELAFKPGGYHLMLIGLKEPLAEGMRIPATLVFEKAGKVEVELSVESMAYGAGAGRAPAEHKH